MSEDNLCERTRQALLRDPWRVSHELELHISHCSACAGDAATLRHNDELLRSVGGVLPDHRVTGRGVNAVAGLATRIEAETAAQQQRRLLLGGIAAGVCTLAGASAFWQFRTQYHPASDTQWARWLLEHNEYDPLGVIDPNTTADNTFSRLVMEMGVAFAQGPLIVRRARHCPLEPCDSVHATVELAGEVSTAYLVAERLRDAQFMAGSLHCQSMGLAGRKPLSLITMNESADLARAAIAALNRQVMTV